MNTPSLTTRKMFAVILLLAWLWIFVQGGLALYSLFKSYRLFTVISGSMEPELPTGCIIVVQTKQRAPYSSGDIITFLDDNEYITHRVKELAYEDQFVYRTQGDANTTPDRKWVAHSSVVGSVVFVTPLVLNQVIWLLKSGYSLAFLLCCAAAFTIKKTRKKYRLAGSHIIRQTQWHITDKQQ